jgi:hypothetical protein
MPHSSDYWRFETAKRSAGPLLIAVGLTLLLVSLFVPEVPTVTAMAIVACGATQATFARFSQSPGLPTIMLLHASVYLSLYATFVCAILYLPAADSGHALSIPAALDLAASILPMSVALQAVGRSLHLAADSRR